MAKAAGFVLTEEGEEDSVQSSGMFGIMVGRGGNLGWDN